MIVDVVVKDVDFPERAVRIGDPELRLPRVTALDAFLPLGVEPGGLEAALNLDQLLGVSHAQPDVIEVAAGAGPAGNQRQHERRLRQIELGVVGSDLGRLGAEQHAVERDRAVEIRDVERGVELAQGVVDRASHSCHLTDTAFGPGIETRNAATLSRSTHGASVQSAGVYDPVSAAHCAKMSGPIADARTVSICAAP